ncbi:hypothetical protein SAMN05443634_105274 [Chishuiella changwenlii]|nr:hypothetical protein [Chishuiella changwenlii]SHL06254.1 hypothetical protein SAMN05443634_105274 [Chishuiella changwenlii]
MRNSFIVLFFIFSISIIFSSFSTSIRTEDIVLLDYVIKQSKESKDSASLKVRFDEYKKNANPFIAKNLDIIYKVQLAKIYTQEIDKLNPKSQQLLFEALKQAKKEELTNLYSWLNTEIGFYYYTFSNYEKAYPYFMESSKLLDTEELQYIFQKSETFKKNAFFFMNVKELNKAEKYLHLALKYTSKSDKEYGTILNAIGHIYIDKKNYKKANHYFELTKNNALRNDDEIRYAKALGDIALININDKDYNLAIKNLKENIAISERENDPRNLMFAKIRLGKLYLKLNEVNLAKDILNEAQIYASTKNHLNSFEHDIYSLLLEIAVKTKSDNEELIARRKLDELDKSLKITDGENVINEINWNIQKQNFNYQYEAEKIKSEKSVLLRNTLIVIAFLLILIIIFVYISSKRRIKIQHSAYENKVLSLKNEKLKSDNKLNKTTNTLNSYKDYLLERNRQIEVLNNEITKAKNSSTVSHLEEEKGELNKLLDSHLMTDENWINFKNSFTKEQKSFVDFLHNNFSDLTESNLRIIFLMKLDLRNHEISQLLGISIDSVKKAKQRLKKKYDNFHLIYNETIK